MFYDSRVSCAAGHTTAQQRSTQCGHTPTPSHVHRARVRIINEHICITFVASPNLPFTRVANGDRSIDGTFRRDCQKYHPDLQHKQTRDARATAPLICIMLSATGIQKKKIIRDSKDAVVCVVLLSETSGRTVLFSVRTRM